MPQEMRIDRALDHGQAQPRDERVFHLLPEVFGVRFFVFHGYFQNEGMRRPRTEIQDTGAKK